MSLITAAIPARAARPADKTSVIAGRRRRLEERMSFALWRGVVGMVRPTRRPGTLEELIRVLPAGIGIIPLLLNFKAGSTAEFRKSITQHPNPPPPPPPRAPGARLT